MRRRAVHLPLHWMDMEILFAILRWYLRCVRKLHPPAQESGMHWIIAELLAWRCSHLVLRRAHDQEWQQLALTIYDACTLDLALTCFVAAVNRSGLTAGRRYALAYIARLREHLRGLPLTPKKQTKGGHLCIRSF